MSEPLTKIGLTGGIACGKSAIARYLTEFGVKFVSVDKICHQLSKPEGVLWHIYQERYGDKALMPNGTINRKMVASLVFADPVELAELNRLTHPILRDYMEQEIANYRALGSKILFLDVPLLYEAGWDDMVSEVWVVYAAPEVQMARLMRRDKLDEAAAKLRLAAQMSPEEKCARADVVINNSGTWEETTAQVQKYLAKYFL